MYNKKKLAVYDKKKLAVWLLNLCLMLQITSFDLLEILCRIYVPFVYRERFRIITCFRRSYNPISLAFSNVCASEKSKSRIEASSNRHIPSGKTCWDRRRKLDLLVCKIFSCIWLVRKVHLFLKEWASLHMPRCRNYWKVSLQVAFDYGRPTYLLIYKYKQDLALKVDIP